MAWKYEYSQFKPYSVPWFLEREIGRALDDVEFERLKKALPLLKKRKPKTLVELVKSAWWCLNRPDCWKPL